jgi:hypothetical protein
MIRELPLSRSSISNLQSEVGRGRVRPVLLLAWVVALVGVPAARAADEAPPATQPAKGALDSAYVDGSFGFSVRPPAGCTLYKEKQVSNADVEIARFVHVAFQWSFSVRLSMTSRPLDAQALIEGLTAELTKVHEDLKVINARPARIASRDGVRLEASFRAGGSDWLRHQAVIPFQGNEHFVLVLITPIADRETAESLFDRIVDSFTILRDERLLGRINAALDRGTALLHQAAEGKVDIGGKLVEDNYLRCLMAGEEIGFVRITERLTTLDHRKGVYVSEWGWLFNKDGTTSHLEHEMFLALDLSFERWENRLYVIPAGKVDKPQQVLVDLENAVRTEDQLGVAYLPRPNAREKKDKVISVEKSYASAAWNVLFPRLVNLERPEVYAFSCYKSERRGMILRTMEVLGPKRVPIDGRMENAYLIEDSEGLIPPKSQIYVDKSGRLIRLVAEPLEMVATTRQYVEQRFGSRVSEAQDLFKRLQPPPPSPPVKATPKAGSASRNIRPGGERTGSEFPRVRPLSPDNRPGSTGGWR